MVGGRIRQWWLLIPAVGAQLAADHLLRGALSLTVLIAGYVLIAGFLWANRLLVGSGIMAVGLAANAVVVIVNGGMPVRPSAIIRAGLAGRRGPAAAPNGARHHLQGAGDHLTFLDDHLALRPIHQVVSYGDVLLVVGAIVVLVHLVIEAWAPPAAASAPGDAGEALAGPDRGGSTVPGAGLDGRGGPGAALVVGEAAGAAEASENGLVGAR